MWRHVQRQCRRPWHWQASVARAVSWTGVGLHSGKPSRVTVSPAPPGSGIVLTAQGCRIVAAASSVSSTTLATKLQGGDGRVHVQTVEHLLAALFLARIDNAEVHLEIPGDGASTGTLIEPAILDGSAAPMLAPLLRARVYYPGARRRWLRVLKPVVVTGSNGERLEMLPLSPHAASSMRLAVSIDYPHPLIGRQSLRVTGVETMRNAVAGARTFILDSQLAGVRAAGLARGGSLDNALVYTTRDGGVQCNSSQRYLGDEPVRHKTLDLVGDVCGLLGAGFIGSLSAVRPGHSINTRLVQQIRETPGCVSAEYLPATVPGLL